MDILTILVGQPGHFINRDELIARVWPDTTVDEAALRVHISALRKTLGDGNSGIRFIANAPRRGYSFVAPVASEQAEPNATLPATAEALPGNDIAASLTSVIGRDTVIVTLSEQLTQRRLLTVLGPAGIGKTTVAAAVAEHVRDTFERRSLTARGFSNSPRCKALIWWSQRLAPFLAFPNRIPIRSPPSSPGCEIARPCSCSIIANM
jgi:DNA-binding winged helix-turn-helix (wHTH) protein